MACILQGVDSVFETDLFRHLIEATASALGARTGGADRGVVPRHRGPSALLGLPDLRRRAAVERGPRLCAAPDHAPRDAPCAVARRARTADASAGLGAGARDGPGLSGSGACRKSDRGNAAAGRDALPQDAGARPDHPRREEQLAEEGRHVRRRYRVHAVRHLWLPARSDPGRAEVARHRRRYRVVHRRDGKAAAPRRARHGRVAAIPPARTSGFRCARNSAPPNFWATRPRAPRAWFPRWSRTARMSTASRPARPARSC